MSLHQKTVFFDRDGVLNRAIVRDGRPYPPASVDELQVMPGAGDILKELQAAGFLLIGVTNQPDVARGQVQQVTVEKINQELMKSLPLEDIRVCYHDDKDNCACRKPLPGLLLEAGKKYDVDFTGSYMIGDRWRDMEAGRQAGCRTIFIDYGYTERQPETFDYRVNSLQEAAQIILGRWV